MNSGKKETVKTISKSWNLILRDYEKAKKEGVLSLEEEFEDFHSGFYGKGLRRVVNDSFDFDLAKEIAEEKNKDSQFLKYFYYVAWNTIRYGGDIYQNLRNFSRLLFFESVI